MNRRSFVKTVAATGIAAAAPAQDQSAAAPRWWERGQDGWYYKDDWKALYLSGAASYRKRVDVPSKVRAAYAYVWATGATLRVNGREVGRDVDDGTIENYDLAAFLAPGENLIEIVNARREVILEGVAVLESGREIAFGTDATWAEGGQVSTSAVRNGGPRGYMGDAHCARILEITAEQKAKAFVNRLNSARVRILDRERFLFWRARNPREVLALARPTPERQRWEQIENLLEDARGPIARASALVHSGEYERVEQAAAAAAENTRRAEELLQELMHGLKTRSLQEGRNRLGWVTSAEPLDNDPVFWEFDLAPEGAATIGLAGRWDFQVDTEASGARESAWKPIYAPSKWGWERQGITEDTLAVKGRCTKPYNGHAWYRKRLAIPASWAGSELTLLPGIRGQVFWLAVNGRFLHPLEGRGSNEYTVRSPANAIAFGESNTFELRVYNADNIGGILSPLVRLSRAGYEPRNRRSICGAGLVREMVYRTEAGAVTQVVYSSPLSPGAVVATSGRSISLAGWQSRGYAQPNRCAFASGGSVRVTGLSQAALPDENWLLLWSDAGGDGAPRPVLIVFDQRPAAIEFRAYPLGGAALTLRYREPGARVVLLRPFDDSPGVDLNARRLERIRLWSRAMTRYPVDYSERLAFEGERADVRMEYEYLDLGASWRTRPLQLAPLPMLFSYALEKNWPGAAVHGEAVDLGCRARGGYYPQADCGVYRAVVGEASAFYSFQRAEPKIHLKGVGTLGEELRIGEPLFADAERWGFNSIRPQMYFHQMAGFFEHPDRYWNENSRLVFNESARAIMDGLIDLHRRHGQMFIMNWFWNLDRPGNEPNRAVVNSSRYWRFAPAVRAQIIEFWTRMAEHCKDLPPDAVCYDYLNEPSDVEWGDWNRFLKDVTAAVRKVDPVHRIAAEAGGGWAQPEDLDLTEPTGDPNTIYEWHAYGPHTDDCHRSDLWYPRYELTGDGFRSYEEWEERLLPVLRFGIRTHAEMFHGEFGLSFIGPDDSPRKWLEDLLSLHEKYRMHWNWWNYSGGDIYRTGLKAGERVNPLVETLSAFARRKA
jgi:hypothetical protein